MSHLQEYKNTHTCGGWQENEPRLPWAITLMFKDAHGQATIVEQVMIEISNLLASSNVHHISESEIREQALVIVALSNRISWFTSLRK